MCAKKIPLVSRRVKRLQTHERGAHRRQRNLHLFHIYQGPTVHLVTIILFNHSEIKVLVWNVLEASAVKFRSLVLLLNCGHRGLTMHLLLYKNAKLREFQFQLDAFVI